MTDTPEAVAIDDCQMPGEQAAWDWLDNMVSAICDEHPSDIAFSAEQMVDAFIAGRGSATRLTDAIVRELVEALERNAEGWANAVELSLLPMRHWQTANDLQRDARQLVATARTAYGDL